MSHHVTTSEMFNCVHCCDYIDFDNPYLPVFVYFFIYHKNHTVILKSNRDLYKSIQDYNDAHEDDSMIMCN